MTTETALHIACRQGQLEIAQGLHSTGASLDATDVNGDTPLHFACMSGHLDVARWLHSSGCASLDAANIIGWTPLHYACRSGLLEIAQLLCSLGADASFNDNDGHTPAQLLVSYSNGLDEQALRSTLACLVRRAQAQGPLSCPAALVQALKADATPALQVQRRRRPQPHPARV